MEGLMCIGGMQIEQPIMKVQIRSSERENAETDGKEGFWGVLSYSGRE